MSRSTCGAARRSSVGGPASRSPPRIAAWPGSRPASATASSRSPRAPRCNTSSAISGPPSTSGSSSGTMPGSASAGRSRASRSSRRATRKARSSRRLKFFRDGLSVRILLTGRGGQVGWELERLLSALGEVVATDRAALDLAGAEISEVVSRVKPTLIVNAAAYTAVDKAETETDAAMRVNGIAPGILAEEAKRLGALLVHYSTDYVFDGEKQAPYVEDDAPNPLGAYGASKLEGERRIRASGCRHLIVRTSWVYGARGRNFFLTMRNARQPLRVVDDQRGVPTSSRFLAEHTVSLIDKNVEGLLHLVPSGATTWY